MLRIIAKKNFTTDEARRIGETIGIDWAIAEFGVEQFKMGLDAEHNEHGTDPETDVTHGDVYIEGKIAWAHLKELSDYYTRLKEMEGE
ncbi:MAG: DUF5661 family protein [Promethearchaeota archaeon]|jgi:hypothetical protein